MKRERATKCLVDGYGFLVDGGRLTTDLLAICTRSPNGGRTRRNKMLPTVRADAPCQPPCVESAKHICGRGGAWVHGSAARPPRPPSGLVRLTRFRQ